MATLDVVGLDQRAYNDGPESAGRFGQGPRNSLGKGRCAMSSVMWNTKYVFAVIAIAELLFSSSPTPAADLEDEGLRIAPEASQPVNAFEKYDSLRPKGWIVGLPGPADTIDQDPGGVRSKLADLGIYYFGMSLNNVSDNQLPSANRAGTQLYNGQKFTFSTQNLFGITYDLARYGIPDGQFLIWGAKNYYTWNAGGPSKFGVAGLTYYQTLFNKKVELKVGYLNNAFEFIGTNVGGAITTSVFGPSGSIYYQGGLDNATTPTFGGIVKYNFDTHFYTKATVQRAVSPDGFVSEVSQNPSGFSWQTANTGVLYLDEMGYQRAAASGVPQTWVRAGVAYNTSQYTNLQIPGKRSGGNSFYYVLADRQFWQMDAGPGAAGRGIYGGFSAMYAPPDLNKVSQYYELRAYGKGLLNSRPDDMVSFIVTSTTWSHFAVESAIEAGKLAHRDSQSISLSYSAHLAKGVYSSVGLSYVNHPTSITYSPTTGSALNLLASLNIFL